MTAGESGFVTANVAAVPSEAGTYKVEFDIYTDEGEALPVPADWERLYTEFTVDPCAKVTEPKLENIQLSHHGDKVLVTVDVPDTGGADVSLSAEINGTSYEMTELQSGGYGAAGWGHFTGDDDFVVTADNGCYDTAFTFQDGAWVPYCHGSDLQCSSGMCGSRPNFAAASNDPVTTYIGNFTDTWTDAAVAGIGNADLLIQRAYNSGAALGDAASVYEYTEAGREKITGPAQYFGTGWASNLDVFLLVQNYAPLYEGIQIRFSDGHTQDFEKNGSGYEPSTPDNFDTLTQDGDEFVLERKHSLEQWRFGADGNLKEIQDRNGNTITYTYTNGLLTEISEGNRSISFKHDADGHIIEAALPEDIVLSYEYEEDLLVAMTDGEGNRTEYRYNEEKQLTEIVTPLGHSTVRMSYDERYRVAEQVVGESERYSFAYQGEDAAEATTITDSYGNATIQRHDEDGRQKEIIHPDGSTEQFEYDAQNNRTRYVDPAGGEYSYTYDVRGNRLTLDGPLGLHKQWEYNLRNLVNSTTEKIDATRERSFTFTYDDNGNLKQFCLPLGDCGSITYDEHGLPLEMTDLRGNTTKNAYDAEGDLISVTDPEGAATAFNHDDLGRIIGKTKPLGNAYSYSYDNNSNLVAVDGPLGFHIGYEYDANNNLIQSLDPNGGAIKYDWTASDSIAAVTNQLGFSSSFAYGLMNERTGRTDAEGREWTYTYDNMLRVIDVSGPLGLHQGFVYNALGRITDATDPEGRIKHVEYDDLGRPLSVTRNYLPGGGEDADTNVTTSFSYDLLGNRLSVTDPEGYVFRAEYDLQNRLQTKQDAEGYEWEYSYDPMGNLLSVLNPRGYSTDYAYTPTNRLQSVSNPEAHTRTLAYNGNGKLTQVIDPMGTVTAFAYNELDRR
ncbi:MAG: RHS repeat protein, partial [Candidatus Electrothrix sp. MAN1_4]|nr:RHS repeat protein [Candidatus Electrothrix sp. MAN1_4]